MLAKRLGTLILVLGFVGLGIVCWLSFETERQRGMDLHNTNQRLELQIRSKSLLDDLDAKIRKIQHSGVFPEDDFLEIVLNSQGALLSPKLVPTLDIDAFVRSLNEVDLKEVNKVLTPIYLGRNDQALQAIDHLAKNMSARASCFVRYHLANLLQGSKALDAATQVRQRLVTEESVTELPQALIADLLLRLASSADGLVEATQLASMAKMQLLPTLTEPREPVHFWLSELTELLGRVNASVGSDLSLAVDRHLSSLRLRSEFLREDFTRVPTKQGGFVESSHGTYFVWWSEDLRQNSVKFTVLQPIYPKSLESCLQGESDGLYAVAAGEETIGKEAVILGKKAPGFSLVIVRPTQPDLFPWRSLLVLLFVVLGVVILVFGFLREQKSLIAHRLLLDAKSDFLANVSHQLKTPVANLRLFAETLADDGVEDPVEKRRMLDILIRESTRLGNYLHHIMSDTRLDAAEFKIEEINLQALLTSRLEHWTETAALRHLRVRLSTPEDFPLIRGDATALVDGLDNVVENALAFSPDMGLVEVRCRLRDGWIELTVSDQGPGIPESDCALIFNRFYRGEHALARQGTGTGLGLYIAKVAAERAEGTLEVQESGTQGTTMVFRFPVVERQA